MASNYTGNPATAATTLSLMTGSDPKTAQSVRVPLERLLDNDAAASALSQDTATRLGALVFRELSNLATISDTGLFLAVAQSDPTAPAAPTVVIKDGTDDVFQLTGSDPIMNTTSAGALGMTDFREAAASADARIAVIGIGGTRALYSDDAGTTWQATGGALASAVQFLAWAPPNSLSLGGGDRWYAAGTGNSHIYVSPDADAWTAVDSDFSGVLGLAVLGVTESFGGSGAGYVVALGASGIQPRFSLNTFGTSTDFGGFQTPPNAATAEEPGSIAGAPLSRNAQVYHVMRCNAGARLRTAFADDGFTWQSGATIEAPDGFSFSAQPRLLMCPTTGLAVIVAPVGGSLVAVYASQDFVSWSGPAILTAVTQAFAVAGGRVFYTRSSRIFATSGVQ
jgi:hypothetical protein